MARWIILLGLGAALLSTPVLANSISVDTELRGWVRSDNAVSFTNNYIVGNLGTFEDTKETRNHFSFVLPTFQGQVTSAVLTLGVGTVFAEQSPNFIYQLTSVNGPPFYFDDLGTGTLYASVSDLATNFASSRSITLNAAALAAITSGGTFRLGGRLLGDIQFGPGLPIQALFGSTSTANGGFANLTFTTASSPGGGGGGAVPEPASWAMLIAGFGLVGAIQRRRRPAIAA